VRGDPAALRRLLLILLDNAIKYSAAGSTVTISVTHIASDAVVSVADQGSGIAPEVLPHIFDRFFRADPARNSEGSGLGLSIAQWIAHAHGGSLIAESTPGTGTTFRFTLPAVTDAETGRRGQSDWAGIHERTAGGTV
jgi:signal transduction histidine kinase